MSPEALSKTPIYSAKEWQCMICWLTSGEPEVSSWICVARILFHSICGRKLSVPLSILPLSMPKSWWSLSSIVYCQLKCHLRQRILQSLQCYRHISVEFVFCRINLYHWFIILLLLILYKLFYILIKLLLICNKIF